MGLNVAIEALKQERNSLSEKLTLLDKAIEVLCGVTPANGSASPKRLLRGSAESGERVEDWCLRALTALNCASSAKKIQHWIIENGGNTGQTTAAVYQAVNRLARTGKIRKISWGQYAAVADSNEANGECPTPNP